MDDRSERLWLPRDAPAAIAAEYAGWGLTRSARQVEAWPQRCSPASSPAASRTRSRDRRRGHGCVVAAQSVVTRTLRCAACSDGGDLAAGRGAGHVSSWVTRGSRHFSGTTGSHRTRPTCVTPKDTPDASILLSPEPLPPQRRRHISQSTARLRGTAWKGVCAELPGAGGRLTRSTPRAPIIPHPDRRKRSWVTSHYYTRQVAVAMTPPSCLSKRTKGSLARRPARPGNRATPGSHKHWVQPINPGVSAVAEAPVPQRPRTVRPDRTATRRDNQTKNPHAPG